MSKITVISTSIRPAGLEITRKCLMEQTFTDIEWIVDLNWTGKHDLNAAYNRCLMRAKGELIVSLQDHISIQPDALQRLWEAYQDDKRTFFTCPVGKIRNQGEVPVWDWRIHKIGDIAADECEFDFGAFPLKALLEIGGFDEQLDQWWSMDNVSVCRRAEMLGYKFRNADIRAVAMDHDAISEHPFRKDYRPVMANLIMEGYAENPILPYLTLANEKN